MNKNYLFIVLMSVLGLVFAGCHNIPTDATRVTLYSGLIESGTRVAVHETLKSKPELGVVFEGVSAAISLAVEDEAFTPAEVSDYITRALAQFEVEVDQLWIESAVNVGMSAYTAFYKDNPALEINDHYKELLRGLARGLNPKLTAREGGTLHPRTGLLTLGSR